jgi:uncharacterized protein
MDAFQLTVVIIAFVLGGLTKGIVGLGLPTVALAILGTALGPAEALPLLVAPAFLTNVWQAAWGGHFIAVVRRLWPMLLATIPGVVAGTMVWLRADRGILEAMLGITLCAYALTSLRGFKLSLTHRRDIVVGPVVGLATGVIAGATGTLVLPVVPYLHALKLERDALVQAMGLSFALSSLVLGIILASQSAASLGHMLGSALAVLPAIGGMWLGQTIRARITPARFGQILFASLLVLGAHLIWRGVFGALA